MWKPRKQSVYEIVEERTNRVVTSGLTEDQAQALCDTHNNELSAAKWNGEPRRDSRGVKRE